MHCVTVLGEYDPECLDREHIYKDCFYGQTIPKDLWRNWKTCTNQNSDDYYEACQSEMESIKFATSGRSKNICKSLGITEQGATAAGGPQVMVEHLMDVIYASHWKNIFKPYDPRKPYFKNLSQNQNQNLNPTNTDLN
eukprot:TRINITY_DN1517_c0_g1_i1.p1 TRINITY_DN1517_c0_g1~~TRINITY_DN1517_c0_g1_i1.p1  ORF type:complete len:138 (-),score=32.04 TRINITY_DN1517_c0_g1_i1:25-438(-)